jgi:hypothetical protein
MHLPRPVLAAAIQSQTATLRDAVPEGDAFGAYSYYSSRRTMTADCGARIDRRPVAGFWRLLLLTLALARARAHAGTDTETGWLADWLTGCIEF